MSAKIQAAILAAAMITGGLGLQHAAEAMADDSRILLLVAQYKMFTGDTDKAVQLLRRATSKQNAVHAPSPSSTESCPYSKS